MAEFKPKSVTTMASAELAKHVQHIVRNGDASIRLGKHTKWERMPERSITFEEIRNVILRGVMTRQPEPGKAHDEMKCRFDGKDTDRKKIGVELSVKDSRPGVFIITVIRYEK